MKRIISILLLPLIMVGLCCCVVSCNKKPKKEEAARTYKFVKILEDGEQVDNFKAKNDTDALNRYFEMMEKVIIANLGKEDSGIKAMYVISPEGDTLNTNKELIEAVSDKLPSMTAMPVEKASKTPAAPLKPIKPNAPAR